MRKHDLSQTIQSLSERLMQIDYDRLPISDYNKKYISTLKPAMRYYMKIYGACLYKGSQLMDCPVKQATVIDYGGGSGFLSMLAKAAGFSKVIYLDLNPLSVKTIKLLKEETGIGPDVILQGNSDTLAGWCKENKISPNLLVATDLIEHVYNLETFFNDLSGLSSDMQMVFTTASTPFNPYVKRRLHRLMDGCESGTIETPNYYSLRKSYIEKHYPDLSPEDLKQWSIRTRGLIYEDISKAIDMNTPPVLADAHNTCDPATGNWTERILPVEDYQSKLKPYNYVLKIDKGFYNTDRKSKLINMICKSINFLIRASGKMGLLIAPFIFLSCARQPKKS